MRSNKKNCLSVKFREIAEYFTVQLDELGVLVLAEILDIQSLVLQPSRDELLRQTLSVLSIQCLELVALGCYADVLCTLLL